jgi:hypothetical protein
MQTLKQLDRWHETRSGLIVLGAVELGAAYLFFSLAVNSGSLWQWSLSAVLAVGALRNFFLVVKPSGYGKK